MLKIKLARFGKRNQPHYRIVVNEARDKRDGSYTDLLGRYVPTINPKILEIDVKKYDEWITKGAQPTETVASLYQKFKSGNPFPAKKKKLSKKAIAKAQAEKEEKEKPAEVSAETPPVEVANEEAKEEEKAE